MVMPCEPHCRYTSLMLSTLFQSMSPASVNGVAEIVYTPFADASSSWVMGLAFPGFRKRRGTVALRLAKCTPHAPGAAINLLATRPDSCPRMRRDLDSASVMSTRPHLLPVHSSCSFPCG